jgi:hypothetical protein
MIIASTGVRPAEVKGAEPVDVDLVRGPSMPRMAASRRLAWHASILCSWSGSRRAT